MIELKGLTKTYVSQTNQKVEAVKSVSFTLDDTGMVFVLGKSGSGKSTLLNLLGGLDSPTAGEIVVDGVSMKDFAPTDYDSYRNGYVGFIFQEYNLLKELNVQDNVALALQLRGERKVDENVAYALQQVELSQKYLRRRVNELSGGEKQRVAIARCIVKDSKLILADEPTGNLDSATSESIWKILKNLSQSRLVVVVSHDRESAEKYADRIIEIADGRVIADNGSHQDVRQGVQQFHPTKTRLPFLTCIKMGAVSMLRRKAKAIGVVLLSIFCLLALLIAQMCACFSQTKTIARFVKQCNVPYVVITQQFDEDDDDVDFVKSAENMSKVLDYLSQHTRYFVDNTVANKQEMLDFGFTFVGQAQELTPQSYYVTSDELEENIKRGNAKVMIDGELVQVVKELHSIDFLIGKQVDFGGISSYGRDVPVLAGVIDSDGVDARVKNYTPRFFTTRDSEYYDLADMYEAGFVPIYVQTSSVRNLSGLLNDLTNKFGYELSMAGKVDDLSSAHSSKDVVNLVEFVGETIRLFALLSAALCLVLFVILVLLVINLVTFSILDRKREIGILSALGTSNSDVTKIFIFEVLVISAICFVVTLLVTMGVAAFINSQLSSGYSPALNYLRVDFVTVLAAGAVSFGLLPLATLIPIRKISKLNPIDAIRVQ